MVRRPTSWCRAIYGPLALQGVLSKVKDAAFSPTKAENHTHCRSRDERSLKDSGDREHLTECHVGVRHATRDELPHCMVAPAC